MKYMLLIYQGTAPTPRAPDALARLSDAIELPTRIPAARLGGAVEVRPVVEA